MRIHTDHAPHYIEALAASLGRDPFSLEAWKCLHIQLPLGEQVDLHAVEVLKASNKDADCDIVVCPDHDVLLISRAMGYEAMHTLGAALCASLEHIPEAVFYDLFRDWQAIRVVLETKQTSHETPSPVAQTAYDFGQIEALSEVFHEASTRRAARKPLHIMIVEDDAMTRRIVANSFKQNYALITAENGEQAVANYLLHAPDVVFLDIGLPDASGFEVLRQILTCDPSAYVVMFSGSSYLDNVTQALVAGASGFVAKPFRPEKLHHYIQANLNRCPVTHH
ncbi:MAG: response regulator [Rickettsiales bacterium]